MPRKRFALALPPHFSKKQLRERKKQIRERELIELEKTRESVKKIPKYRYMQGFEEAKKRVLELSKSNDTIIVAVSGPQGTGKTTIVSRLAKELNAGIIPTDIYFKSPIIAKCFSLQYDDPRAVKLGLLGKNIKAWRNRKDIRVPVHDLITHRQAGTRTIPHKKVLFIEGFMAFHPDIRNLCDLAIYFEASPNKRLKRRLKRDVKKRGRKPAYVRDRFYSTLEESRLELLEKWKPQANLIIIT